MAVTDCVIDDIFCACCLDKYVLDTATDNIFPLSLGFAAPPGIIACSASLSLESQVATSERELVEDAEQEI